jgi:hypothetical protein
MKNWWRRFAVLLLFVALPLQGAAATLAALSCAFADKHQAAQTHTHGHQDASSHQHDSDAAHDHSQHHCCYLFASSLPASTAASAPSDLPAFEPSISLLATLFIPERPQRPPRT